MYATRLRTAAHADENIMQLDAKCGAAKDGRAGITQSNNRRALEDIGNVVAGSLSRRLKLSDDNATEYRERRNKLGGKQQQVVQVCRPSTRRFVASLANSQIASKTSNEVVSAGDQAANDVFINPNEVTISRGAKQRRKLAPSESLDQGNDAAPNRSETNSENEYCAAIFENDQDKPGSHVKVAHQTRPARMRVLLRNGKGGASKKGKNQALKTCCETTEIDIEKTKVESELYNIDKTDVGNIQAVVTYVEDIYRFYRETEVQSCASSTYISNQVDINEKMRAILIDWLIEVHLKFKLIPETLFLTINVIDRYLSCENVSRKNLQLVGVTAMLVAAKYEEIWAPEVQDFVFISDSAYTRDQILDMEKKMLNTLSFNLTVPTPYVFVVRFLKAAASDRQMDMMALFLLELTLVEYKAIKFAPSLLAAAAVYTALCTLQRMPFWTKTLEYHSGYSEEQLRDCASMMVEFHKSAGEGNLTVVQKKYSGPKFDSVAVLAPAILPTLGITYNNINNQPAYKREHRDSMITDN